LNLFELTQEFQLLQDMAYYEAEENEGEISEGVSDALDAIEADRDQKIENTICLYKNIASDSEAIGLEINRLTARKKALDSQANRVKDWLRINTLGEKLSYPRGEIRWRKSESVHIDCDPSDLDKRFQRVKVEADKTGLKKAIKAGEVIDNVTVEQNLNIVIK